MTRRGLLGCSFGAVATPKPQLQQTTTTTEHLFGTHGWKVTTTEPSWLASEKIDERNAKTWQPREAYTITVQVHK